MGKQTYSVSAGTEYLHQSFYSHCNIAGFHLKMEMLKLPSVLVVNILSWFRNWVCRCYVYKNFTVHVGKLQCPARHHANMSIVPPAISHLSITPSRPAVASGVFSNSARPSHSISTSNVGDAVSDLPCDPILSPLPHPSTPTASSFDTLCTYDGIWPKNTTSKQQRPSLPRTHLFTSKYQQELDAGLSTSPSSSSFVIERFNSVYKSVSTQPETEEFGSDNSCSPLLGVDEVLASLGVLRRAPAGLHVTVTGSDGCRVYLNLQSTLVCLPTFVYV